MRTALISDIHGNRQALETVLQDVLKRDVDNLVCLGDVATLGPSPKEVLHTLQRLESCVFVMGNHEQALFEPERCEDFKIVGPHLTGAVEWCIAQLEPDDFSFMRTFRRTITHALGDGRELLGFHASPESTVDGIDLSASVDSLRSMFDNLGESVAVLAGGHTHEQLMFQFRDQLLINPGSVGVAFRTPVERKRPPSILPLAEYAILESADGATAVEFRRLEYDIEGFVEDVLATENPLNGWWIEEFERLGIMQAR